MTKNVAHISIPITIVEFTNGLAVEILNSLEDIRKLMKLPAKFRIDTPVGPSNSDWSFIMHEDGEDWIYMIRETKSALDDSKLRPSELAKIKYAKRHFEVIGVEDYGRSVPVKWGLQKVSCLTGVQPT